MKERPILFNGEMVRAILDGRKTQTRRAVKLNAAGRVQRAGKQWHIEDPDAVLACPYGRPPQVTRRPIPSCSNYEAGDDGNIYRRGSVAPLKHWMGGYECGYRMVSAGAMRKAYVHRLVCEAFYGVALPEFPEVRHLNGNTQDNRPQNLDWATKGQNAADRSAHGRASHSNHGASKLTAIEVAEIRASGLTRPAIAEKYGISKGAIDDIIDGRTWLPLPEQPPANFERYVTEQPGDRLYIKETHWAWGRWETRFDQKKGRDAWHFVDMTHECGREYAFEQLEPAGTRAGTAPAWHKRPSLFMPCWASRITLEIVSVRIERLLDLSYEDAIAEGCAGGHGSIPGYGYSSTPREHFRHLWDSINGADSWDANPWVWCITFRRIGA
ncbi:hypothetical protein GCM10027040_27260 [Halomonas shantousis]